MNIIIESRIIGTFLGYAPGIVHRQGKTSCSLDITGVSFPIVQGCQRVSGLFRAPPTMLNRSSEVEVEFHA